MNVVQPNIIALHSRKVDPENIDLFERLLQEMASRGCRAIATSSIYSTLAEHGLTRYGVELMQQGFGEARAILSIGGDGTFLEAAKMAIGTETPILGINRGRLGFLSDVPDTSVAEAIDAIIAGNYRTANLDVISLYINDNREPTDFAINEFAVSKCDNSSMLTIRATIDGDYLTTYWADGLIIATATGSTAYSMSVGGPIVYPSTPSLIITPIAPHNLTVRPLIVPNTVSINLQIEGRGSNILTSLDGRNHVIDNNCQLRIAKTPVAVKMMQLQGHSFYATLRRKLMWGADSRNI